MTSCDEVPYAWETGIGTSKGNDKVMGTAYACGPYPSETSAPYGVSRETKSSLSSYSEGSPLVQEEFVANLAVLVLAQLNRAPPETYRPHGWSTPMYREMSQPHWSVACLSQSVVTRRRSVVTRRRSAVTQRRSGATRRRSGVTRSRSGATGLPAGVRQYGRMAGGDEETEAEPRNQGMSAKQSVQCHPCADALEG